MKYKEAKQQFIKTWGKLGSEWCINRTMAQVHSLLLIAPKPLSTDNIMEELQISRGNANMNLRELINWTLVSKELVPGDRMEYFVAEKNIWEVARRIASERKKREIEPAKQALLKLKETEVDSKNAEVKEFIKMMTQLSSFVNKMDKTVDTMMKAEENWFFGTLFKMM